MGLKVPEDDTNHQPLPYPLSSDWCRFAVLHQLRFVLCLFRAFPVVSMIDRGISAPESEGRMHPSRVQGRPLSPVQLFTAASIKAVSMVIWWKISPASTRQKIIGSVKYYYYYYYYCLVFTIIVLVSTEIKLAFFLIACIALCFGFRMGIRLITQGCFS